MNESISLRYMSEANRSVTDHHWGYAITQQCEYLTPGQGYLMLI